MQQNIVQMGDKVYEVKYTESLKFAKDYLKGLTIKPDYINYDVESTGLHLRKDVPTIASVAWHTATQRIAFVFPVNLKNLNYLKDMAGMVELFYAHNTLFEMHMSANIAGNGWVNSIKNWADSMGVLRSTFESLSPRHGGDKLALKAVAVKYIDPNADRYEKEVKSWMSSKEKADRKILIALLKPHGWGITRFEDAMNKGKEPIPDEVMKIFAQWRAEYPEPKYTDVPHEIIAPYVASDTVITDMLVEMGMPVVKAKDQQSVLDREFKNLNVTFKMTRVGFKADRDYLFGCADNVTAYRDELRQQMWEEAKGDWTGDTWPEFSTGQHALIKSIYAKRLGKKPEKTDAAALKKFEVDGDKLAPIIRKLRSVEKWLTTYLMKHIEMSDYDGRIYTSLNQFNPVTGRYSGDFQQMPKEPLLTLKGDAQRRANAGSWSPGENGCDPAEELYYPRKSITNDDDGSKMFFLDFSQVELRTQAHYTIPFGGDLNLCRAYMPFKCVHSETGEIYDFKTEDGKMRWSEMRHGAPDIYWEDQLKQGWSAWVVPETKLPWVPTDVHSSTAEKAMEIMGMDPKKVQKDVYKFWRNIGKRYNFMKVYGGGPEMSSEVLDITMDQAYAIDDGFLQSFPVIRDGYQVGIERAFQRKGYIVNLYGRRYYISNPRKYYTGSNYCIQGTCADDLKEKTLILDAFFEEHGLKSYMMGPIHDELIFKIYDDEQWIVPELCEMMMYTPKLMVPLVVEPDYTETNWAEKQAYKIA